MEWLSTLLVILQVISALAIIGLVLIQQGKGADMGAAFGSGASGSVFGSSGSSNFLSRSTAIFAVIFFLSTLGITWMGSKKPTNSGVLSGTTAPALTVPTSSNTPTGKPEPSPQESKKEAISEPAKPVVPK
jgi:preprotein translocase subunit SecG